MNFYFLFPKKLETVFTIVALLGRRGGLILLILLGSSSTDESQAHNPALGDVFIQLLFLQLLRPFNSEIFLKRLGSCDLR
jgi:hypothetical protein